MRYDQDMAGYTKLFGSIVHSTIWRAPNFIRIVWVTMLALADKNGEVEASVPGLADVSRVTLEECEEALAALSSPDEYSRSKDHDGRRIATIDGGWQILNYLKYRELKSEAQVREATRIRVARFRGKRNAAGNDVTPGNANVTQCNAIAEAEAEAEGGKSAAPKRVVPPRKKFSPPTLEEVRAEVKRRGSLVDPEAFHASYETSGWKLKGGQPIVDWKACITTWEKNRARFEGNWSGKPAAPAFDAEKNRRLLEQAGRIPEPIHYDPAEDEPPPSKGAPH